MPGKKTTGGSERCGGIHFSATIGDRKRRCEREGNLEGDAKRRKMELGRRSVVLRQTDGPSSKRQLEGSVRPSRVLRPESFGGA